ncbi:hypothetical protein TSAR_016518 [Trichomalopsis sarcophagae]|uniref:Uncharacterized protein n=1 Tax=Trichomalopsis sarcophagae TaxID=543379 RepID=A0A232F9E5_9HYME|nr:hypothetical protein TSAR_016518 [Trichomalopsis sarcophagae]
MEKGCYFTNVSFDLTTMKIYNKKNIISRKMPGFDANKPKHKVVISGIAGRFPKSENVTSFRRIC